MSIRVLNVELGVRSYPIRIGAGLLHDPASFAFLRGRRPLLLTDEHLAATHLAAVRASLNLQDEHILVLPPGEPQKTWDQAGRVLDWMLQSRLSRDGVLVALGGGVIGDLAGFCAALYQRGIDFVQLPTTLLAQVDSSVGGKTAVNHARGKNLLGAFHQPIAVLADTDTLATLPARELRAGLAEVIKYGPIHDLAFLDWIEANLPALRARDPKALAHAVQRSCEIKSEVVGQDEREAGLRAILNFGHTFGHAIEAGLGYGEWLHGEGVGCGMVMAARLSHRLGLLASDKVERLVRLVEAAGLPVRGPQLKAGHDEGCEGLSNAQRYLQLMRVDKKAEAGEIKFVLVEDAGRAVVRGAPDALVAEVIDACCA